MPSYTFFRSIFAFIHIFEHLSLHTYFREAFRPPYTPGSFRLITLIKCLKGHKSLKTLCDGHICHKHHHYHHQYPYHLHLRCTVVRRTPTSPSSLTTTACSAQSRPRMGRRATHWSSATHSPLEPQTHLAMGSLTPSGLTCSTFFSTLKSGSVC